LLKVLSVFILIISTNVSAATASWYGKPFHGRLTASGEVYNMNALTAAHNSLPFGTKVEVTNLSNKKKVTVRINDTGGFAKYGRVIDLSKKANQIIDCNLCKVKLRVLK
jgi:rare lipoprotein A